MVEPQLQYLNKRIEQDVLVLTVTASELCNEELTDAMRHELVAVLGPSGKQKVALDFQNVSYIASPGIRLLLAFRRHCQDVGCRLILCSLNSMIADVLKTARLINTGSASPPYLFETAPDAATGVARLKS